MADDLIIYSDVLTEDSNHLRIFVPNKEDMNNYRPISVIPTVARVFERLVYNQIYKHLTKNNLLSNKQYGFRSLHSTALALSESTNHWLLNMGNGKMNSVIF